MEIKNRPQTLAIVAIAALAILLGDRLVFTPLVKSWKARSERIAALKKSIAKGTSLLERENVIRGRWEKMRTNTLPNNGSLAESQLLKAFDRWTQDSRVSIGAIKPQWKPVDEDYTTLECRADATGSMEALSKFLFNVEKDSLPLKVEMVDITARDDSGKQLSLGLQLSGLLLLPPPTQTPKP